MTEEYQKHPCTVTFTVTGGKAPAYTVHEADPNEPFVGHPLLPAACETERFRVENEELRALLADTQETLRSLLKNVADVRKQGSHIQQQILAQLFLIHTRLTNSDT